MAASEATRIPAANSVRVTPAPPPSALRTRLRSDRFFQLGLVLVGALLLAGFFAPVIAPYDPVTGDLSAAYLLRPGGRFAVRDVVADEEMDEATRQDMQQWTGCIAGALTRREFERELNAAGFEDVEIRETHRVHEHAVSAIIRARVSQ